MPAAVARALVVRLAADFRTTSGASHVGPLLGRSAADTAALAADWLDARRAADAA